MYNRGSNLVEVQLARAQQRKHAARIRKVKSVVETKPSQESKWHRFKASQRASRRRKRYGKHVHRYRCRC